MKKNTCHLVYHIVFSCIALNAFAQKTPDIQIGNIWLSNGKADAKLTEWQFPLKAYNKATKVWYSIANDDKYLYLVIQSTLRASKIFSGGLTFSVNEAAITFPYPKKRDFRVRANIGVKPGDPRKFEDYKEIHISGIKSIKDTMISIYNLYGIQVAATTYSKSEKNTCDYEMAIPLKILGLSTDKNTFSYNVKLNGIILYPGFNGKNFPIPGKTKKEMMEIDEDIIDARRVSQFSGKYTLAEKP